MPSSVWTLFTKQYQNRKWIKSECTICHKSYKNVNSGTSLLISHLKNRHTEAWKIRSGDLMVIENHVDGSLKETNMPVKSSLPEQNRRIAGFAKERNIKLSTVDAVQGREKDVVILLLPEHFSVETADFLGDDQRMNVALTRSRHGQFILGHKASLKQLTISAVSLFINHIMRCPSETYIKPCRAQSRGGDRTDRSPDIPFCTPDVNFILSPITIIIGLFTSVEIKICKLKLLYFCIVIYCGRFSYAAVSFIIYFYTKTCYSLVSECNIIYTGLIGVQSFLLLRSHKLVDASRSYPRRAAAPLG
uniref:BED-type domain-containing protein n=1 Tax=Heterorhabditis bacteriophora TaxID=37862 RepID=A0A1I7W6N0_HETBA